jgi:O-succinylbenzoate synthase
VLPSAGVSGLTLIRARLPLARPFATRLATRTHKDVLLVRLRTSDGAVGWGECAAEPDPTYAPEFVDGVWLTIRDHLAPRLFARGPSMIGDAPFADVAGNRMAKAALEMALLDAQLRTGGVPLARWLGATRERVPVGVVVEQYADPAEAATVAARHVAEGYRRIKVKISRGADRAQVAAVRAAIPDDVALWADANGGYSLDDAALLDSFGVDLLEQPLPGDDLLGHAALRRSVRARVCLDESIASPADARLALHLDAAASLALKPGRLGGLAAARAVHDLCRDAGVGVWCGGMLETGIGRAANLALSALPGFTDPGDVSATDRYFANDLTEPFVLGPDGCIEVPRGPGLGVTVDEDLLASVTVRREELQP